MRPRRQMEALVRLVLVGLLGNAGSAAVVTVFGLYLAPTVLAADEYAELQRRSLPALVIFTVTALIFAAWWVVWRPFAPIARWLADDRLPDLCRCRAPWTGVSRHDTVRLLVSQALPSLRAATREGR